MLGDEALLTGLAVGDPELTTAFVRRFQARAFGVALAIVGDRTQAEDVCQLAFERVWRHAHMYDARRGSVLAWFLTITRNLALDQVRARRPAPADTEHLLATLVAPTGGPEDQAVAGDSVTRVRAALADLPADQARALVLAVFKGLTRTEIAQLEGIPVGTAKTRIRAALAKLRAALCDDEEVGPWTP